MTYGILALLLYITLLAAGVEYDSGGIGGFLVLTFPIWGFVYWAPDEILFSVGGGTATEYQMVLTLLGGLVICFLLDRAIFALRKAKNARARRNT